MKYAYLFVGIFLIGYQASAYQYASGVKYPNDTEEEGYHGVRTQEPILDDAVRASGGFNELLPYVLATPNQENGGTCLFMSLTGTVEYWLAKLNPQLSREKDGPIDLSERYFMNADELIKPKEQLNWKTDKIFVLNHTDGFARNSDYRYTKGYYKKVNGEYTPSKKGSRGARYGTPYNWINIYQDYSGPLVKLPSFDRKVFFADPKIDQWEVTVLPEDINTTIKNALKDNQAPVQIIYNHYGFWHAVMIVGYNDDADSNGCKFTTGYIKYIKDKSDKLYKDARRERDRAKRAKMRKRAKYYSDQSAKVARYLKKNPCSKGMFYVRDSIYKDTQSPYDYNPKHRGDEGYYSYKTVLRDYSWTGALGNHVFQVVAED